MEETKRESFSENERNIDVLMDKHKTEIAELRQVTQDVVSEEHDDVWMLRYILSNKTVPKAEKAVRYTVEYRKQNKEWLEKAKLEDPESYAPHREIMKHYSCSTLHKSKVDGGPVLILRGGLSNPKKLLKELTKDQVAEFLVFQDEIAYLQCDRVTRETRNLTKLLVINDMNGFSLMNNTKKFFDALGISSKISENIYPQLLTRSVAVNPAVIYKALLGLASVVVSKKTMEKFSYCKGDTLKGDISQCPFASKHLKKEDTPTFLGGECTCPEKGGCVDGIPNNCKEHPYHQMKKEKKGDKKESKEEKK